MSEQNPQQTAAPELAADPAKAWKFAMATSVFGKRAMERIKAADDAAARAAALAPKLVTAMVEAGLIDPRQEKDAHAALGDHARSLEVLKTAVDRLAAQGIKMAAAPAAAGDRRTGGLGRGVGEPKTASDADRPRSPFVGSRAGAGQERDSDRVFKERLGVI